ncbi:hypothetical protein LOTGIDRAFT_163190 [Lottia gigantea]|uniref:Uncharacterized protein n=1 Tax=Lottia gigantea TaxID=225164 RepID=V3ZKJ5_LOTGI|nr:hypothetical protein LOTGIDRAFT_163190 [Lottia gigantea]ESO91828.1 hypothetical protein LOTGIDRAFT_163190 [Lottia gigantea]
MTSLPPSFIPKRPVNKTVRSATPTHTPPETFQNVQHGAGTLDISQLVDNDSIQPEDSASNVKRNSEVSVTLSALRYKGLQREIELKTELESLKTKTDLQNEKEEIQRRIELANAETKARQAAEKALKIKRKQELKQRIREIERKEKECA